MALAIEFRDVSKDFAGRTAVDRLTLGVEESQTVALVGPSGCGKTTSLKMINRLIEPSSGEIRVAGRSIGETPLLELRRSLGYVIQYVGLFPHMTVAENVAAVPTLLRWPKAKIEARVDELLDLVGLPPEEYRTRRPRALSGGQQQRVGVARALAADPPVLLMDEPFGALDPITRARLQDELKAIQRKLHKTVVIVTHDMDEAVRLADKVAVLRAGRLVQFDAPSKLLLAPADSFVADLLGRDRLLKYLRTVPLRALAMRETGREEEGPKLSETSSLEEALLTMLAAGVSSATAVGAGGQAVGTVTAARIVASATAAVPH
ncbi:MAG TPA: ABC transporter ATP-binding protein [Kiloniellales bacterium]|nr:ABC transporter ATP-binding protein [Kiloniellales bacterium]